MSGNDDSYPWDRQHDDRIVELLLAHPFWSYEQIADALREHGIFISAIQVTAICAERRI